MTSGEKKQRVAKITADFPALRAFFEGYLHQDFRDEYGSAVGAARAFWKDASDSELAAVRKEWRAGLARASAGENPPATAKNWAAGAPAGARERDPGGAGVKAK